MKKGEMIIWNSGFGYDVGYFIGNGNSDNTYMIEIVSGLYPGEMILPVNEIFPYSDELVSELTKRYGYEKAFSKIF